MSFNLSFSASPAKRKEFLLYTLLTTKEELLRNQEKIDLMCAQNEELLNEFRGEEVGESVRSRKI